MTCAPSQVIISESFSCLLEALQPFATSELEVDQLECFATPEGSNDLYTYNQKQGKA